MAEREDPAAIRQRILDGFATTFSCVDHEVRLTTISLLIASWGLIDDLWPDEVGALRQEMLARLAAPHLFVPDRGAR